MSASTGTPGVVGPPHRAPSPRPAPRRAATAHPPAAAAPEGASPPAGSLRSEADAPAYADAIAAHSGFDAFYRTARPTVARALALALGDPDLGTEACDEAMTRACERWAKVGVLDSPEGWVYRVGLNWATSVLRSRRRRERLYQPAGTTEIAVVDPIVHEVLGDLDVGHRAVVVCRHLLGWSVEETARALQLREGTVKSRLHRANRILQARLRPLGDASVDEES